MAEMSGTVHIDERSELMLVSGERIVVKIFNPDGTEKNVAIDTTVPNGKTFNGTVVVFGKLS